MRELMFAADYVTVLFMVGYGAGCIVNVWRAWRRKNV